MSIFRWVYGRAAPILHASEAARRYRLAQWMARFPATRISGAMFPWAMSHAVSRYAEPSESDG